MSLIILSLCTLQLVQMRNSGCYIAYEYRVKTDTNIYETIHIITHVCFYSCILSLRADLPQDKHHGVFTGLVDFGLPISSERSTGAQCQVHRYAYRN